MLLASRIVIVAVIVGILVIGLAHLKKMRSKILFLFGTISIVSVSILLVPSVKERVSELMSDEVNSTSIRYSIFDCSTDLVKSNWLFGASIENAQNQLDECYDIKGIEADLIGFNSHNEYLNILLTKGVFLLIAFLTLLFVLFIRARGNILFIVFLCIFAIVCFTENLLERQMGVFFFSLFAGAFVFLDDKYEKTRD